MCGRLNVTDDPLAKAVSSALGINFTPSTSQDLWPTQTVSTISSTPNHTLSQLDTSWGIKPTWSKKLLINAQAETVDVKKTFRRAFSEHRCIVPCGGWYEWSGANGGGKKTKYLFEREDGQPIYMAGIWYEPEVDGELPKLVTLTTEPNELCAKYHHRMPLLLPEEAVSDWVLSRDMHMVGSMLQMAGISDVKVSMA